MHYAIRKSAERWLYLDGFGKFCVAIQRIVCVLCFVAGLAFERAAPAQENPSKTVASESDRCSPEFLQQQIKDLSAAEFRVRELARWRLERTPSESLAEIEKVIRAADQSAASQLVDILSAMAIQTNTQISLRAQQVLVELAQETSSIGRLANNTLRAIADVQEEKAIEILTYHGATIGLPDFPINGRKRLQEEWLALKIDERFTGGDDVVQWIRYLKSIECVYLLGPGIDSSYYRAVRELKQVKAIKLKHVHLSREDLRGFGDMDELEHLGLLYMEVDDSYLPELMVLPASQSIQLYGTHVSEDGEIELRKQLDGIEIFRGNGGFLGVIAVDLSTLIDRVTLGSAAQEAGILAGDRITHVDGSPISKFDELREQLGRFRADESVKITLNRMGVELTVEANLGEEPEF